MSDKEWRTHNPSGSKRVVVTKELPGDRWLEILTRADCKVEICTSTDILSAEEIEAGILMRYPAWQEKDILPFLGDNPPRAAPSIVNAKEVGVPPYTG